MTLNEITTTEEIIREVRFGDRWERVKHFNEVKQGFLEWRIGSSQGLAQPKNWRKRKKVIKFLDGLAVEKYYKEIPKEASK